MWQLKRLTYLGCSALALGLIGFQGQGNLASASLLQSDHVQILPGSAVQIPHPLPAMETPAARQVYLDAAAGRGAAAKQARNAAISSWLGGLHDAGLADFSVHHMDKGVIYEVRLRHPIETAKVSALWVAVPDGLDLPSSVLLHQAKAGGDSTLELQSCTSKETLAKSEAEITLDSAKEKAVSRLNDYLDAPDPMRINVVGGPHTECRELANMLPRLTER